MYIIPAILTGSPQEAQQYLDELQNDVEVDTVHFDIIDGLFIENSTITPTDIALLNPGKLDYDFHLMTEEPLDFVYEMAEFKEQFSVRAITAQVERMSFQYDFCKEVRANGYKVGLSLDLYTPIEAIDEESWSNLDIIQLMGVEAGAQGKVLSQSIFFKLQELQTFLSQRELHPEISVDGGVRLENLSALRATNVESVVVGSGLWEQKDEDAAIRQLWREANIG